jgi:hypothetical protein
MMKIHVLQFSGDIKISFHLTPKFIYYKERLDHNPHVIYNSYYHLCFLSLDYMLLSYFLYDGCAERNTKR